MSNAMDRALDAVSAMRPLTETAANLRLGERVTSLGEASIMIVIGFKPSENGKRWLADLVVECDPSQTRLERYVGFLVPVTINTIH